MMMMRRTTFIVFVKKNGSKISQLSIATLDYFDFMHGSSNLFKLNINIKHQKMQTIQLICLYVCHLFVHLFICSFICWFIHLLCWLTEKLFSLRWEATARASSTLLLAFSLQLIQRSEFFVDNFRNQMKHFYSTVAQ